MVSAKRAQVHQHSQSVHFLHDLDAKWRETMVRGRIVAESPGVLGGVISVM